MPHNELTKAKLEFIFLPQKQFLSSNWVQDGLQDDMFKNI